jgi:hypothetical protein
MGIREDANLTTEQYGTLSWLFYLAFLLFEMPHAYLIQRLPTAKYLGGCVCAWGTVGKLTLPTLRHNYHTNKSTQ